MFNSRTNLVIDLLTCILGLLILASSASAISPGHQVVMTGSITNVTCTVPHPVEWSFQSSVLVDTSYIIYNGLRLTSSYHLDSYVMVTSDVTSEQWSTLTIWNTTNKDAGVYTCTNSETQSKQSMHLIILGSQPTCHSTTLDSVGRRITLQCSIQYSGSLDPVFKWSYGESSRILKTRVGGQSLMTSDLKVTRNVSISVEESYWEIINCNIYFILNNTSITKESINNTGSDVAISPFYEHACTINYTWPAVPLHSGANIVTYTGMTTNMSFYIFDPFKKRTLTASLTNGKERRIFNGFKKAEFYNESYDISLTEFSSVLTIWNTSMNDAGRYVWTVSRYDLRHSAELIVFASDPTCQVLKNNMSEELTELSCSCNVSGYWSPTMEWTRGTRVLSSSTTSVTNHSLTSTLSVQRNVSVPHSETYEEIYKCRTYFTLDNKPDNTDANNVPGYTHTCDVTVTWPVVRTNYSVAGIHSGSDESSSRLEGTSSKESILNGMLFAMGGVVVIFVIVIVSIGVYYRRRLVQERRKVQRLEEGDDRKERLKKPPASRTTDSSIVSIVLPTIRTSKLKKTDSNSTYAEIDQNCQIFLVQEAKPCHHIIESTYAELDLPESTAMTYSTVNKRGINSEPDFQHSVDMLPLVTYSEVIKSHTNDKHVEEVPESPYSELDLTHWPKIMQNKEQMNPSPLYSEVNKKRGNDEQAPQNRHKMENKVIYSDLNKKNKSDCVQTKKDMDPPPIYSEVKKKSVNGEQQIDYTVIYSQVNKRKTDEENTFSSSFM